MARVLLVAFIAVVGFAAMAVAIALPLLLWFQDQVLAAMAKEGVVVGSEMVGALALVMVGVIALLALESGELPGTLGSTTPDAICGAQVRFATEHRDIEYAMNNSFGFGGNNCSLLFGRVAA